MGRRLREERGHPVATHKTLSHVWVRLRAGASQGDRDPLEAQGQLDLGWLGWQGWAPAWGPDQPLQGHGRRSGSGLPGEQPSEHERAGLETGDARPSAGPGALPRAGTAHPPRTRSVLVDPLPGLVGPGGARSRFPWRGSDVPAEGPALGQHRGTEEPSEGHWSRRPLRPSFRRGLAQRRGVLAGVVLLLLALIAAGLPLRPPAPPTARPTLTAPAMVAPRPVVLPTAPLATAAPVAAPRGTSTPGTRPSRSAGAREGTP